VKFETLPADSHRRAVITALRTLARDFDAEIVAEGVENATDSATLQGLGITLMQGFHFAEPQPAEAVLAGIPPPPTGGAG